MTPMSCTAWTGRRARGAFTLIEMLIVISIILFLAAVLVVSAMKAIEGAKVHKTKSVLWQISQAMNSYYNTFRGFPPPVTTAGVEWWRYLTLDPPFDAPMTYDSQIWRDPFIEKEKLFLPETGTILPRDGWWQLIEYQYPVDNDAANLVTSDAKLPTGAQALDVAQSFYHAVLISKGKDKQSTASVLGRLANADAYEAAAGNADNIIQRVGGQ